MYWFCSVIRQIRVCDRRSSDTQKRLLNSMSVPTIESGQPVASACSRSTSATAGDCALE